MGTGVVKWFNDNKGYGFITDDETQKDVFVHASATTGLKLCDGDRVEFKTVTSDKGPKAVGVRKV